MRLSEFIRVHRDDILKEWMAFARSLFPPESKVSDDELRDHAEKLLTAIVDDMTSPQSTEEQAEKSKGRGREHGMESAGREHAGQRIETGLKLDQLVSEYRALRASALRLWEARHGDREWQGELTRYNEAIDEALAEATHQYIGIMKRTSEEFLAVLGHDLRNPLSAILMSATRLASSKGLDYRQAEMARRIVSSAGRMERLIKDLLDFTRTRLNGGIPIMPTPTELAEVCEQVISELAAQHPDRDVRFRSQGDLLGEWDRDRLAQVVSNLVGNALQHGSGDHPVTIVAAGSPDEVVLRVHNLGPPIPQHALEEIFEPMVRHPSGAEKTSTSLGLGLYIAREVVAAHGGRIDVTSTLKEGTAFTVHLPRRRAASQLGPGTGPDALVVAAGRMVRTIDTSIAVAMGR